MEVLEHLHRTPEDPDATGAHDEYRQIQAQVELEKEQKLDTLVKCLMHPGTRKRMIYGFLLQWLLQSTGVLVVFNYQVNNYSHSTGRRSLESPNACGWLTTSSTPPRPSSMPTLVLQGRTQFFSCLFTTW